VNSVELAKLVVLDTLAAVRPVRTKDGYTEDYDALAAVHRLANDLGLGILVLHHTRKMDAEEFEEAAEFLKEACRWRLLGDADDVRRSDTKKKILAALAEIGLCDRPCHCLHPSSTARGQPEAAGGRGATRSMASRTASSARSLRSIPPPSAGCGPKPIPLVRDDSSGNAMRHLLSGRCRRGGGRLGGR
jgi:hypothetical protein